MSVLSGLKPLDLSLSLDVKSKTSQKAFQETAARIFKKQLLMFHSIQGRSYGSQTAQFMFFKTLQTLSIDRQTVLFNKGFFQGKHCTGATL